MKSLLSLLLCFAFYIQANAQNKLLTAEDVAVNFSLYPRGLRGLQWVANSSKYSYMLGADLQIKDAANSSYSKLIKLSDLNNALKALDIDPLKGFLSVTWLSANQFYFVSNNTILVFDCTKDLGIKTSISLPSNYANLEFKMNGSAYNYSYTLNNELFVNGKLVEKAASDEIVYGQSVSRNEFGISKGTFWSPNQSKLAFYKNDQSKVTNYPMFHVKDPIAEAYDFKYPMAGQANEIVRLGVYDVKTSKVVYMETGDVDQYLTNISWSPNNDAVFIGVLNRGQDHLKWQKYDAKTGKLLATLFEEKDEQFVEPLHAFKFLPNKKEFIYQSWKDGYTHLYLYDINGKEKKQLTEGAFEVTEYLGIDDNEKYIYFVSTEESPTERHLYKVSIKGGKRSKLTKAEGMHNISMSDEGAFFIDNYANMDTPLNTEILSDNGKVVTELNKTDNPMAEYAKNIIELNTLTANDGKTTLHYRMVKPYNFDPSKKYPAIVYVYGGSHAQMVTNGWMGSARMWDQYMAHKGYIVFTLDNRGSDNRGQEFEQITHRQAGEVEMQDQLTGLSFLKNLSYVDSSRVGVHGWSYGGFMTKSFMTKTPKAFKVGVCGGPVIDWKYYEIMYTERYMDSPQENPEGYEKVSLLNHIDKLEGKLLIVHGADDDVVVWQHTLALVNKCIDEAVLFDYFIYPDHKHHVRGKDRIHLIKNMSNFFFEHL